MVPLATGDGAMGARPDDGPDDEGALGGNSPLTRHPTTGSSQAAELSLSGSVCQAWCSS